jgi:hypothetical protein
VVAWMLFLVLNCIGGPRLFPAVAPTQTQETQQAGIIHAVEQPMARMQLTDRLRFRNISLSLLS